MDYKPCLSNQTDMVHIAQIKLNTCKYVNIQFKCQLERNPICSWAIWFTKFEVGTLSKGDNKFDDENENCRVKRMNEKIT